MSMIHKATPRCVLAFLLPSFAFCGSLDLRLEPGDSLTLQVRFDKGFGAAIGPAPVRSVEKGIGFLEEGERAFAQLRDPKKGGPSGALAVWKAADVLSNAQGAISFWARIHPADNAQDRSFPLLRLTKTDSGEWTLVLKEIKYVEKKDDKAPKPEDSTLGEKKEEGTDVGLDEKKPPVAAFVAEAQLELFAEGNVGGTAGGKRHVHERGAWHHVVWSWRSVHHTLFIDGVDRGSPLQLSRLQPIASPDAILELLACDADIADLRVFRRALEPAEMAALAKASPDQHLPSPPPLRLWADWGPATGRSVVYADVGSVPAARVELACVDAKSGRVLTKATMASFPSGLGERVVPVTEPERFPPGTCRFEGVAFDKDGKELAKAATADWSVPEMKYEWIGSRAGLDKKGKILPPYTPIEVKGETLKTSLRDHTLGRTGLFKSIVAAGEELFAAPVSLDIVSGGKPLVFGGGPGLKGIQNQGDEAGWSAATISAEGHTLEVAGHMEYDGVARFDVTLVPKGNLEIERAELNIRYRPETIRLVHSLASGFIQRFYSVEKDKEGKWEARNICWNTYAPKTPARRDGVIFDSNDLHHEAKVARSRFVPFVHVGNFDRGLAWFADNDSGWVHDGLGRATVGLPDRAGAGTAGQASRGTLPLVPTMEVVATDADRRLRLNVVARPTVLTDPLRFRFYLLANPFKPLPEDWRTWVVGDYRRNTAFGSRTRHQWWWHWNEYAQSFHPYPGGVQGRTYQDWVGRFRNDPVIHAPFINFGSPGGCPLYGGPHFIEMAVLPYSWKLHNTRPHQDYMAYWLDRCVREIGIRGVYIDEPYSEPYSYNVLAGDAPYIRPDGTRACGYRFMEGRDYIRRLRQMFTDHGLDYSIWLHTTNYKVGPVLTFADVSMDGEHPQIWVPSFSDYHIFYNPLRSRGYIAGTAWGLVGTMMFHGNTDPKTFPGLWFKSRTYLACTLPFGILPQTIGITAELDRIRNLLAAFGIFDAGIEDLHFEQQEHWLPGSRFEPEGMLLGGVRNRAKHEAILFATAPWKGSRFELIGGLGKLDLGKPFVHAWNAETGESLVVEGKTTIDLLPNDVAVILARGADEPQKPRPDGALLGVSFDKPFGPDFGGGLAPLVLNVDRSSPPGVEGKSGKAFGVRFKDGLAGYPVVPSWVTGTIEFDLHLRELAATPLRLVELKHYLEATLAALVRDGRPGLLLTTAEVIPGEKLSYSEKLPPTAKRETFFPLSVIAPGAWSRVVLTWRSGQYDLYWDGRLLGRSGGPAAARLRDAEAMACGLWVGDGRPDGPDDKLRAAIDSLLVYDWAFRPEDAAAAKDRPPMVAAKKPPRVENFPVWVWGEKLSDLTVGINLSAWKSWEEVSLVKFALFEKAGAKEALGKAELTPWMGTGVARIAASAPKAPASDLKLEPGKDEGLDEAELGRALLLRVELYKGKDLLVGREIPVKIGGKEAEYPISNAQSSMTK